jgi:hypothetical protein
MRLPSRLSDRHMARRANPSLTRRTARSSMSCLCGRHRYAGRDSFCSNDLLQSSSCVFGCEGGGKKMPSRLHADHDKSRRQTDVLGIVRMPMMVASKARSTQVVRLWSSKRPAV